MAIKLNKKRTAILSLDVQNDLVPISADVAERKVLENIAGVIRAGRAAKAEVIHITASVRPDFRDIPKDSPLWINIRKSKAMIVGSKGAAIHDKAKPRKDELVMNKTCVDPFIGTNLAQALHNADANTLLIIGLWTNYVVEATARHASDLGYRVFIVEDACASNTTENHDFAIKNILPTLCYITTAKEVRAALK